MRHPKFAIGVCAAALVVAGALVTSAQEAKEPEIFFVNEATSMFGDGEVLQVYRDGTKAVVEIMLPPSATAPKGTHTRSYYDLAAHTQYTIDVNNPTTPCGIGTFGGDWGNPFSMSSQITKELAQEGTKPSGTETVNGVSATIYNSPGPTPQETMKVWVDAKSGLVVKMVDAEPKTLLEVKQFSLAKPAASVFALPASCQQAIAAAAAAAAPDMSRVSAATGGNITDYLDASQPPASSATCSVNFKVVQAKTLQPITSGFQVALDIDPTGATNTGFTAGTTKDVSARLQNGVLHIANPPGQFTIAVSFASSGQSGATIYRQCPQPQSTLMLVMKNPANNGDGTYWIWSKTGK